MQHSSRHSLLRRTSSISVSLGFLLIKIYAKSNLYGSLDKKLNEYSQEGRPGWVYWESYTRDNNKSVVIVEGVATNKCTDSYLLVNVTSPIYVASYKLNCEPDGRIRYSFFYDKKCESYERDIFFESPYDTFTAFTEYSWLYVHNWQYRFLDTFAYCLFDYTLPIPTGASFALMTDHNSLEVCTASDSDSDSEAIHFLSYRQNQCVEGGDYSEDGAEVYHSYLHAMPWVYYFFDQRCERLGKQNKVHFKQCRGVTRPNYLKETITYPFPGKPFIPADAILSYVSGHTTSTLATGSAESGVNDTNDNAADDTYSTDYAYADWDPPVAPTGDDLFPEPWELNWSDDIVQTEETPYQRMCKWQKIFVHSSAPTIPGKPTPLPSHAPSAAPTRLVSTHSFAVLQQLNNISPEAFQEGLSQLVFAKAVASALRLPLNNLAVQGVNRIASDIWNTTSAVAAAHTSSSAVRALEVPTLCFVRYRVHFNFALLATSNSSAKRDPAAAYQFLTDKLQRSIETGALHTMLQHYSADKSITVYSGVTLEEPAVSGLEAYSPDSGDDDGNSGQLSSGAIIGIVVGVAAGMVLIGAVLFFIKCNWRGKAASKVTVVVVSSSGRRRSDHGAVTDIEDQQIGENQPKPSPTH